MASDDIAWEIIATESNVGKKVFRIRKVLPAGLQQAEFSECVMVEWKYGAGLPDAVMGQRLSQFESFLEGLDDPAKGSLQAMVITGNGKREWVYYTKNYDAYMLALNAALLGKPRFPIEIEHSPDISWEYWTKIREMLDEDQGVESVDARTLLDAAKAIPKSDAVSAMDFEAMGKRYAAGALKLMIYDAAENVVVDAREFSHLNLKFYETTSSQLRAAGLTRIIDAEPRDNTRATGKRVLVRYQLSETEPLYAAIYSISSKPDGFFKRLLAKFFGKKPDVQQEGILEFGNEFSDGKFVLTNTVAGRTVFTKPPEFLELQLPAGTPAIEVLETHRKRVADYLKANSGSQTIRVSNLEQISAQENRQRLLKAAYRRSIGGLTKDELRAWAKDNFESVEAFTMGEMRRLIEEFDKKGSAARSG